MVSVSHTMGLATNYAVRVPYNGVGNYADHVPYNGVGN